MTLTYPAWSTGSVDFDIDASPAFLDWIRPLLLHLERDVATVDVEVVVAESQEVGSHESDELFDLAIDGQLHAVGETRYEVLRHVISQLTRRTHERTPQHLHLDAGLVGFSGSSVLVHGPRHGGTSTLIAALSGLPGARYGSDHAVAIDTLTNQMNTWPAPILLRPAGAAALEHTALVGDTVTVPFMPWSRTQTPQRWFSPSVIIHASYGEEMPTRIVPLHPTDAALRLTTASATRSGHLTDTLESLRELTSHARCFSLEHDLAPDAAARLIYGLVTDDSPYAAPPQRAGVFATSVV